MNEISTRGRRAAGTSALAARALELIASGRATSRAQLAELLGAAASSVSVAVAQLVEHGLVAEEGTQSSNGGRPRKVLRLGGQDEFALAADLGGSHARVGVVLPGGELRDVSTVPLVIAEGPQAALSRLAATLDELVERHGRARLRGVGLSLPGPVDTATGSVVQPSRMPGWNRFPVESWLRERFAVRPSPTTTTGTPVPSPSPASCTPSGTGTATRGPRW
ncbi:ROK family protein OS=Streptomyces tendae OX=1932 GN=GUR47_31405 PE=3 SV=1 [Streptomyces tendae]